MSSSRISPTLRLLATLVIICWSIPGCLIVHITDHRIRINDDGSGEALLRLVDIRSDATVDSLVLRDYERLKTALGKGENVDFEHDGRKITSKNLYISGDTLIGEIAYTFPGLTGVYGLHVSHDKLFVVVPDGREILRTNGKVEVLPGNSTRISWDGDAKRLMFQIREKDFPPGSRSLAPYYAGRRR